MLKVNSGTVNLHIYKEKNKNLLHKTVLLSIHSHTPWKLHVMVCSYLLLCARGRIDLGYCWLCRAEYTHECQPPPPHTPECHRFLWSNWSRLKIKVQHCTVSLSVFNDCCTHVGRRECLSCTHFSILLIAEFLLILSGLINQGLIDLIMKSMMWNRLLCESVCEHFTLLDPGLSLI